MTIDDYIKAAKVKEKEIDKLKKELDKIRKEAWHDYLSAFSHEPVITKFKVWAKIGPKTSHHDSIKEYKACSGKELFEYDSSPMWPERRQTFTADGVISALTWSYEKHSKHDTYSIEDLEDWMQAIMDDSFGSMIWDW